MHSKNIDNWWSWKMTFWFVFGYWVFHIFNENHHGFHMRQCLFLQYGSFFRNIEKGLQELQFLTKNSFQVFIGNQRTVFDPQNFGVIFSLRNAVVRCTSMQYEKNGWGSSLQLEDSKRRQLKTLGIVREHFSPK